MTRILVVVTAVAVAVTFSTPSFAGEKKEEKNGGYATYGDEKKDEKKGGHADTFGDKKDEKGGK